MSPLDSKRASDFKCVPKFVENFLEDSRAVDVWRYLFPQSPGFTYKAAESKHKSGIASSRLDYFLVSSFFFPLLQTPRMRIGNWQGKLDHARISLLSRLPTQFHLDPPQSGRPWSIPQPRLFNLN